MFISKWHKIFCGLQPRLGFDIHHCLSNEIITGGYMFLADFFRVSMFLAWLKKNPILRFDLRWKVLSTQ